MDPSEAETGGDSSKSPSERKRGKEGNEKGERESDRGRQRRHWRPRGDSGQPKQAPREAKRERESAEAESAEECRKQTKARPSWLCSFASPSPGSFLLCAASAAHRVRSEDVSCRFSESRLPRAPSQAAAAQRSPFSLSVSPPPPSFATSPSPALSFTHPSSHLSQTSNPSPFPC